MKTAVKPKEGDRVLFTGSSAAYGNNGYVNFFRDRKVYGIVLGETERKRHYCPGEYTLISFTKSFPKYNHNCAIMMFETKDVTVLPSEDYAKADTWVAEAEKAAEIHQKELPLKCTTEATVSYMKRNFVFEERQDLDTNHSYAALGKWESNGKWTQRTVVYRPSCCAFTKTTEDLQVWIPKIWLNYYGYTTYDLVEWLKFLSKCEIGFNYEFLGEEDLSPEFKQSFSGKEEGLQQNVAIGKEASIIWQNGFKGFLGLRFKADPVNRMHTYMRFIAVRYMYNMCYWTIPGHAMQIKKALGSLVTHWEALLLAHLGREYYGYYCFASQSARRMDSPHKVNKSSPFDTTSNYDRHINPYQSVNGVLDRLKGPAQSMNSSFNYSCDTFTRPELNEFFDKKDWMGLYKYTKEKTKQKEEK